MRAAAGIQNVAGQHRVEVETGQIHPRTPQDEQIVLGILGRLPDGWIFQKASERFHLRRIEWREIPHTYGAFGSEQSRRNTYRRRAIAGYILQ